MANYSFSVAMCVYNGARFLQEQLASIAAQTQLPFELIVCDDLSTDDSVAIARKFGASVPFPVRIHVNEHNLGLVKNFERAISLCSGDIIALADQDDLWMPEKISRMDREFTLAPDIGLCFSDAVLIDEDSQPTGQTLWQALKVPREELKRLEKGFDVGDLLSGSIVTGATIAFRQRFCDLVLPIPHDLAIIHDAWIALLIAAVARVLPIDEPLIRYRQHPGQEVGALARTQFAVGLQSALDRQNPYPEVLAIARTTHQRLFEKREQFNPGRALEELEERIAHLQVRLALPQSRIARVQCVFKELLTRRYHHYSRGFRSAVKDVFFA